MKRIFEIVALVMMTAAFAGQPALADNEAHIYFQNNTNAWVWVTAYTATAGTPGGPGGGVLFTLGHAEGAWCVAPHKYDQHGLRPKNSWIYEVRAEVSAQGCQHHPVLLNQLRGFPHDSGVQRMTYYIHFQNGRYVYNNTP